jgi:SOS-response transcriptional repressor LexA
MVQTYKIIFYSLLFYLNMMLQLKNNTKILHTLSISQILTMLMKHYNLDDRSLSKATKVAHTNIARLRLNPNANPTTATVIPLAKFFNITVGQLCGCEALFPDQQIDNSKLNNANPTHVPIIEWSSIDSYLENKSYEQPLTSQFTAPTHGVSTNSFCLKVADKADELIVRKNSLVIVDPEKQYKHANIVLAKIIDQLQFVKILTKENGLFFKYLNSAPNETHEFNQHIHKIIGVIVEVKYIF